MIKSKGLFSLFLFFFLCINLSADKNPDIIHVISDDNYPPYIFRDTNGKLQGITYDLWRLWEEKTGIEVDFQATDWEVAKLKFHRGDADVLETAFYSKERAQTMIFSKPYATIRVPVFYKSELTGIKDISDLRGFTIGAKAGDNSIQILEDNSIYNIEEFPSYEDIIKAVRDKKIHIFTIDEPPALYYLYKYNLLTQFKYGFNLYTGEFHRAVKKDRKDLLNIIENGFDNISEKEYQAIQNKWMGQSLKVVNYRKIVPWLLFFGLSLLAVFVILFFVNILLRKQVFKKTKELTKTLEELTESQNRNSALLNANPDMMFIFSEDAKFVDYKSSSNEKLIVSPEFFIGKSIYEVLPKNLGDMTLEKIKTIKETDEIQNYEYSIMIDNKEEFYDTRMVSCGKNEYLAIVRNITFKKKSDEERSKSNKLESLGILAGGIAHDFNNILTALIGSISLLKTRLIKDEDSYKILNEAEKAGMRAKRLTSQLLTFAKGGDPVKESSDINEIIMESVEFVLRGSNCISEYVLSERLPIINIDKGQISQVIQNLIINAIQAMPKGGTVTIKSEYLTSYEDAENNLPKSNYIQISVKDNGSGISEELRSRIFDPYVTNKVNGTGLGLTICYSIIQKHLGVIKVNSVLGKGSEFIVLLPAFINEKETSQETLGGSMEENKAKLKILLMDDEEQILYIGKEMLEFLDHEAEIARDGEEAITMFKQAENTDKPFDIIIMDLTIPGKMGGKEAIVVIRSLSNRVKTIVTSGYSNDPVMSRFADYGFNSVLIKPFNLESLEKAVISATMN